MKKLAEYFVEMPFLRTPYNYDRNKASDESGLKCEDVSLTKQSFAEECDINTIVRRFGVTGQLPANVRAPVYADFEGVFDFQTAMNALRRAEESFMAMPASVRARFANDPALFVEFCSREENLPEMKKMGLTNEAYERKIAELANGGKGNGGLDGGSKSESSSTGKSEGKGDVVDGGGVGHRDVSSAEKSSAVAGSGKGA